MSSKGLDLKRLYYDARLPTSYNSALGKIYGKAGKSYLSKQLPHQLHLPVRKTFRRRKTLVSRPWQVFHTDLADLSHLKSTNKNYRYILVVIDAFSRMAFIRLLKRKTGAIVSSALRDIFLTDCKSYNGSLLQSDLGKEFYNQHVLNMLEKLGVELYSTSQTKTKAYLAERFIRTLKNKIYRYLTGNFTKTYVDVLPDIVQSYNDTPHSSLASLTPKQASLEKNAGIVYHTVYPLQKTGISKPLLKVGDVVRLVQKQHVFEKGHLINWTDMHFFVAKVHDTIPVTYSVKGIDGKLLPGTFYSHQMQKLSSEPDLFRIEKVLRRKKGKIFVKWAGWPAKYNSWVPKSHIENSYKKKKRAAK